MKAKLKIIFLLAAIIIIAGIALSHKRQANETATVETREINSLLAKAGIPELNDWVAYVSCGEAGGRSKGYNLEANDVAIDTEQAVRLQSLAPSQGYTLGKRDDGYTIKKGTWYIIILTTDRQPALFASVHFSEKPQGFPEHERLCS